MANDGAIGGAVSGAATGFAAGGPWGALAGGIIGGVMGAGSDSALSDAAKAQKEGALYGLMASGQASQRAEKMLQPYRVGGKDAQNELMYQLGFGDPTAYAHTRTDFDPEQFKQYALTLAEQNIRDQRKNAKKPAKTDQLVQNRLAELSAKIDKEGAWNVYQKRLESGANVNGDFFRKRDASSSGANAGYGNLMRDFTNEDFVKDPGYQFRLDEGAKSVQGSAAAQGGLLSGAAMKAMQRYGQGYASNEFANAYNRDTTNKTNRFNRLSGVIDNGMRAAGATGQIAVNQGQQANQTFNNIGDINASRAIAGNNLRQSGFQQGGNALIGSFAYNPENSKIERRY